MAGQQAGKAAFRDGRARQAPATGIDRLLCPENFATSVHGLARAMRLFRTAHDRSDARSKAAVRTARLR